MGRPDPILLAFVLCDQAWTEPITEKVSLLGITNRVWQKQFPAEIRGLTLYLAMTDGHGVVPYRIDLVHGATDEPIPGAIEGEMHFDDPRRSSGIVMKIPSLSLPTPGEYRFRLFVNGDNYVVSRKLFALQG